MIEVNFDGPIPMDEFMRQVDEEERAFWTCPVTGRDCREEPRPVIGLDVDGKCRFYASADAAPSSRIIELARGMSADYLLDAWLHYCMKCWIDDESLNECMRRAAWRFGTRSWAWQLSAGPAG
jgi:hypothetical protein